MRLKVRLIRAVEFIFVALVTAFVTGCFAALCTDSWRYGLRIATLLFIFGSIPFFRIGASIGGLYTLSWSLMALYHNFQKGLAQHVWWDPFFFAPSLILSGIAVFAAFFWILFLGYDLALLFTLVVPDGTEKQHEPDSNDRPIIGSTPECFSILGVSANARVDEIKHAYREQVKLYHPDRVAGLGEELQKLATRKTIELRSAQEEALSLASSRN